jgi:hypothetical protein
MEISIEDYGKTTEITMTSGAQYWGILTNFDKDKQRITLDPVHGLKNKKAVTLNLGDIRGIDFGKFEPSVIKTLTESQRALLDKLIQKKASV